MTRRPLHLIALTWLLLLAGPLAAQQFEQIGDYQIHYSAVNTSFLPRDVTEEHGIQRSPAMALLNVSVLEVQDDGSTPPVTASVQGTVGPLGEAGGSTLEFRSLRIGDTPSQVAVFRIQDDEPMRFDLRVRYDRNAPPTEVSFIQRFYIDR
ncbi:DUF4426 domain-containing protein [Halomonas sp. TRM85114]|uniref:DUF4426 domain-containing protein n=1 Tax=Halomonas jincaotanensis TaxID=2810616 RepID=UPI001BD485BD|nr:DUF4426 domain-containing protein [Halomonas jincaotanensis]MBS9405208.1 DUF4426 domain-containing protein [Halomonas jincaotanensis]